MQAILTKVLHPTSSQGARIKASWLGSATIPYPRDTRQDTAHKRATKALLKKLNAGRAELGFVSVWKVIAFGELPDLTGYAFVIKLSDTQGEVKKDE